MYEITKLNLSSLDSHALEQLDLLTFPQFRCCLRGIDPFGISNTKIIAIAASFQGAPVGLTLAILQEEIHLADIHTLFVKTEHRNKGIGKRLLAHIQEELRKEKASTLFLTYSLGEETTVACEKVLLANGWKDSRPFMVQCVFTRDKFPREWIQQAPPLPDDFQEFLWKDLTIEERSQINIMKAQNAFPPIVSPFIDSDHIELTNSLGLKHGEKIVGWMVTHRINAETIKYTSFFMLRDYRHTGLAIKLLADAIELQFQGHVDKGILELPLLQASDSWVKFTQQQLVPLASSVTYINQAWRTI